MNVDAKMIVSSILASIVKTKVSYRLTATDFDVQLLAINGMSRGT